MRELWFYEGLVRLDPTSTLTSRIVKKMLALNPYATWPLHVKLFTREAVKHWYDTRVADDSTSPSSKPKSTRGVLKEIPSAEILEAEMPKGFTVSVEMEGVDGKTGEREDIEKGRGSPIEVTDGELKFYFVKN